MFLLKPQSWEIWGPRESFLPLGDQDSAQTSRQVFKVRALSKAQAVSLTCFQLSFKFDMDLRSGETQTTWF